MDGDAEPDEELPSESSGGQISIAYESSAEEIGEEISGTRVNKE